MLRSRAQAILVPLVSVVAVLLACNNNSRGGGGGDQDDGGGGGASLACNGATLPLGTGTPQPAGGSLICTYGTSVEGYDGCTLTRTTVAGSAPNPSNVTITRSGSDVDATGSATPSGSWSAFSNALNCNTPLGCLNGSYEVQLTYASIDACPANPELVLQIN